MEHFFHSLEHDVEVAFAGVHAPNETPTAPNTPSQSSLRQGHPSPSSSSQPSSESQARAAPAVAKGCRPTRQLSARPAVLARTHSNQNKPVRQQALEARSGGTTADQPALPTAPTSKVSAEMLGALLDQMAPPPVLPEPDASPERLADGTGQAKLRHDIRFNLRRVIDVFRELDTDSSGEVDRVEFRRGLAAILGGSYARDELDELFDHIDESGAT